MFTFVASKSAYKPFLSIFLPSKIPKSKHREKASRNTIIRPFPLFFFPFQHPKPNLALERRREGFGRRRRRRAREQERKLEVEL